MPYPVAAVRGKHGCGVVPPLAPVASITVGITSLTIGCTTPAGTTSRNLYRGTTPGGETLFVTGATFPYVDSSITPGTTYYYKTTAVDAGGESAKSNEVSGAGTFAHTPWNAMNIPWNAASFKWSD
jgi:hypothetical protein